jgi:predicted RNase H-like HicB family nuclease
MDKYAVIYDPTATGFSAYAPDLPGCIATRQTLEQTRVRMTEAIEAHSRAMREHGDPIPEPSHSADEVRWKGTVTWPTFGTYGPALEEGRLVTRRRSRRPGSLEAAGVCVVSRNRGV